MKLLPWANGELDWSQVIEGNFLFSGIYVLSTFKGPNLEHRALKWPLFLKASLSLEYELLASLI